MVLFFCVLLNASIGVIFKYFEKCKVNALHAIVVNYFVCFCTAWVVNGDNPIPSDVLHTPWFPYSLLLGFVFITVFYTISKCVVAHGVAITTLFQKLSLLAPTIIAIALYNESASIFKVLGILIAFVCIILINNDKSTNKTNYNSGITVMLLPLAVFIGSCIVDTSLFLVEAEGLVVSGDVGFVATLFLTAGSIGLLAVLYTFFMKKEVIKLKNILAGILLGVPNFFSIHLLVVALQQDWGGSIVFPINNVGVLILASLFGYYLFDEILTRKKIYGIALALIAIILISFF